MDIISGLLSQEPTLDLDNILIYILVGGLAGLVRELSMTRGGKTNILVLPKIWKDEKTGRSGWDLGIIGSMICSIFVAVLVDHSIIASATAGIGAPHIIELWSKKFGSKNIKEDK